MGQGVVTLAAYFLVVAVLASCGPDASASHHSLDVRRAKSPPSLHQVLLHTTAMALRKLTPPALYCLFFPSGLKILVKIQFQAWIVGTMEKFNFRGGLRGNSEDTLITRQSCSISLPLQLQRDTDTRRGHEHVRKMTRGKEKVWKIFLPLSRVNETSVFGWFCKEQISVRGHAELRGGSS